MALGVVLNRNRQVPAEDSPAFGAIAERFRRAGDLERAVALCQDGLRKFPAHTSARVTLGWAFLDLGRYDEARAELEQVLKRTPDNLAAIRGLAELHDRSEHDEVAAINRHDSEWMREMAAVAAQEENASQVVRDHVPEAVAPEAADDSISALFASLEHAPAVAHVDLDAGAVVTGPAVNVERVSESFAGVPYPDDAPVTVTPAVETAIDATSSTFAEPTVIASPAFVTPAQAAFEAATHVEPEAATHAEPEVAIPAEPEVPIQAELSVEPEASVVSAATEVTEVAGPVAFAQSVEEEGIDEIQWAEEALAAEATEAFEASEAIAAVEVAPVPEAVAVIDEPVEAIDTIAAMEPIAAMDGIAAAESADAIASVVTAEPMATVEDPLPVAAAARVITPVDVRPPVMVEAERIPAPVADPVVEPLELLPYENPAAPDSVAVLAATDLAEFPELLPDVYVLPAAVEAARADADEGPGPWPPVIPDDPLMPAAAQVATAAPTRERPVIKALNRFLKRVETRKSTSVSEYLAG